MKSPSDEDSGIPGFGGKDDSSCPGSNTKSAREGETNSLVSVLLVDDEPVLRLLVENHLRRFGYQVTVAENAGAALRFLEAKKMAVSILLTDVQMPGMDGGTLARAARVLFPALKIIFMSGNLGMLEDLEQWRENGARFLQKPFSMDELGLTVSDILRG